MKRVWAIRKDAEAVSPVIATILMVAITVVLAAVLYVMVLGFGGGGQQTPTATYNATTITNGKKITVLDITNKGVPWDDITLVLTDGGTNTASWATLTKDALDNSPGNSDNQSAKALGSLSVCLLVTDMGGNGLVTGGDFIQLYTFGGATPFASGTTYHVSFVYEGTGGTIGQEVTFQG